MNEQKQALTPEWQAAVDRWKDEVLIVEVSSNSTNGISCIDITDAEVGDVNIRISVVWEGLIREVYMAVPFSMTRVTAFRDDGQAFETKAIGYVNELLDYARNEDMVRKFKWLQEAVNDLQRITPLDAIKLTDSEIAAITAGAKWLIGKTEEERPQPAEAPDVLSVPRKDLYTVYTAALALLQKAEEWDAFGHTPSVPEIEDLVETLRAHKEDLQGMLDGGTGAEEGELV